MFRAVTKERGGRGGRKGAQGAGSIPTSHVEAGISLTVPYHSWLGLDDRGLGDDIEQHEYAERLFEITPTVILGVKSSAFYAVQESLYAQSKKDISSWII